MPASRLSLIHQYIAQHSTRISIAIIKIAFIIHFVAENAYDVSQTAGPSMLPTMAVRKDWVLIAKSYRRGRAIQLGNLVNIKHPMSPEDGAIKRVCGMPGDFVGRDTPAAAREEAGGNRGREMMIQIPEGHCWLIGDNLDASRDSRFYGPVPLALIKGKVIARVFPWKKRMWFENQLKEVEG